MRDSFVFYKSFVNSAKKLPPELRLELYEAIIDYALEDIPIKEDASVVVAAIMAAIVPQIDANNQRYKNGKKGGRPKEPSVSESETIGFDDKNHRFSDSEPNVNVNANVNANADVDAYENGDGNGSGSRTNADASSLSLSLIQYLNAKIGSNYAPNTAIQKVQVVLLHHIPDPVHLCASI